MPNEFHDVTHVAEFLRKIQAFNALESGELHRLARRLEAQYCPQGNTIFSYMLAEDSNIVTIHSRS